MLKKKHKVIVVGLPKTGTSTLAVMLRMLNYDVTGPDVDYTKGDLPLLEKKFQRYDAFQDYPWCFEWEQFWYDPRAKFIILKRDKASWFKSFNDSYGRQGHRYKSYPYMLITKGKDNKNQFLDYFSAYYSNLAAFAERNPDRFLSIDITNFQWNDLCSFLDEPVPKTIFGRPVKKPHANKNRHILKNSRGQKLRVSARAFFISLVGRRSWKAIVVFFRKQGLIK